MFCAIFSVSIKKEGQKMTIGWNFHNHIARHLEEITAQHGKRDYTADEIETGCFVEAMLDVLRISPEKLSQYSKFFTKCEEYYGKRKHDIPDSEAIALFDAFKAINDK
jgi:hypothetical protein